MNPLPTHDQKQIPDIEGFGVSLSNGNELRVIRGDGVWRVAAKLKRYNRETKMWMHKWFIGEDSELEWAIAKLYDRSYPSDSDKQLALYIIETKVAV